MSSGEVDLQAAPSGDSVQDISVETVKARIEKVGAANVDFVDETVAAAMAAEKVEEHNLQEGEKTPGQLFRALTPAQRAALLATYHVQTLTGVSTNHPLWINKEAVPDTLSLHWLSPNIVVRLGMRGYRRVTLTPETQKWVPNCKMLGSANFITHANYVLCAVDADVKLEAEVRAYRMTSGILEEEDERFKSALQSISVPGLDSKTARKMAGDGLGAIATRGYDPDAGRQANEGVKHIRRDLVRGEGER
jgi:hypothetical protein